MFKTTNQQCIGDHNEPTEESQQKPSSIVEKNDFEHCSSGKPCPMLTACKKSPCGSGKLLQNYGKYVFHIGKLTISMAMFNSYVKLAEGMFLAASLIHPNGEKNI